MKRIHYKRIYYLLNQIPADGVDVKERLGIWVSSASGNRTDNIAELSESEYRLMMVEMEEAARRSNPEMVELELWRRRVIAAICNYHSLMGYYKDLSPEERVNKAKGEAVKAKGNHPHLSSDHPHLSPGPSPQGRGADSLCRGVDSQTRKSGADSMSSPLEVSKKVILPPSPEKLHLIISKLQMTDLLKRGFLDIPPGERCEGSVERLRTGILFNKLSVCDLQALYYGKLRQNRILKNVNKGFENDLLNN
jgi:hypothetical protein